MSTRNKKVSESEKISQRVSSARERLEWNQEQMANALGVSRNYVSMVEGGREPGEKFLKEMLTIEEELANGPRGLLRLALKGAKLDAKDLAEKIGYQIGVVQSVLRGGRITEAMAKKIEEQKLGITAEQLMGGSETARVNDASGQYGTVGSVPSIKSLGAGRVRFIPIIAEAQAGPNVDFSDDSYEHEAVAVVDVNDPKAFALRVRGPSMEPEIKEGDIAVVCPSWQPRNGDEVICRTIDGDVMCKIYQTKFNGQFVILSSYNPAFPPRELQRDEIEWIYPVQSVQKTRRRE